LRAEFGDELHRGVSNGANSSNRSIRVTAREDRNIRQPRLISLDKALFSSLKTTDSAHFE
jgi:hypothetical protein